MPTVQSGGVPISWDDVGSADGRPVLLVHGFASNGAQNWRRTGWDTALHEAGLRGIVVDLRGHGNSGRPPGAEHYRHELFLADLVAVLEALHLDRVGYLGYSFGARLGWDLAIAHPRRIGPLVLGGFASDSPLTDFDLDAARTATFRGTAITHPPTAALMRMAALVPGNDLSRLMDVVEGIRADALPPLRHGAAPATPTCIVNGERDTIAAGGDALARAIGAEYVSLPARSHTSAVSSRRFKEAATAWLKR
ncbi:alpha/beta hydrolase [Microbacterium sp. zg.B48]|uniref:alpha/beta fold hydrolase n=1 Tax=Microbacterium sp. zg.B48 TaxID=2969408 RepID=UPI00214CBF8C|nr:alpha/beta hydrolase [Microbacterium sp. zg.B48]MCR2764032.1 alpha/beta hydrolase [Microbacterium sp. zg.B48]